MKRKFSMFLNIAMLCLCVCAIAFGVYSAKTASLNVTGNIGFTAHNCDVDISGYIYGHSTAVDGEPIAKPTNGSEKKYLTYGTSNTKATESAPLKISGTPGELKFGDVYFSDMGSSGEVEPIYIVLDITNTSKFDVLLDDNSTVHENAQYTVSCSNTVQVLYINDNDAKKTEVIYTLRPAKDKNGVYQNITEPTSVSLSINFSKVDMSAISSDGYTTNGDGYITGVPRKTTSDILIIPHNVYGFGREDEQPIENISDYRKVVLPPNDYGYDIKKRAFYGCTNLVSVTCPSGLTLNYDEAFAECTNLKSVEIEGGICLYSDGGVGQFRNCSSLENIYELSGDCITTELFSGCTSLTSIKISNSVNSIRTRAFSGCTSLTSIEIPNILTQMDGSYIFKNCTNLISVKIPCYSSDIGVGIFEGCTKLTDVTILEGSKEIGSGLFQNCTALTSIIIPSSVTSIGYSVFAGCDSLTSVVFEDLTSKWDVEGTEWDVSDPAANALYLITNTGSSWSKKQ